MKKSLLFTIFTLSGLLFFTLLSAQDSPKSQAGYKMIIEKSKLENPTTFEFDLVMLDTDPSEAFELALIQIGILVNPEFYAGGKVTASIVPGSSELEEEQQPLAIQFAMDTHIIKIPSRTLKPLPKDAGNIVKKRGTIISVKEPGTRICRIRLTNSVPFTKAPASLAFSFAKIPYATSVSRYINGVNTLVVCDESTVMVK